MYTIEKIMKRFFIVVVSITLIALFVMPVRASSFRQVVEDKKGDVLSALTEEPIDKPEIDIKRLTYYQYESGKVVISLQVHGKIDQTCVYQILFNTTDGKTEAFYWIFYTKNPFMMEEELNPPFVVMKKGEKEETLTDDDIFTIINENTLRVTFSLFDHDEKVVSIIGQTFNMPVSESDINVDIGTDNITFYNEGWEGQQEGDQETNSEGSSQSSGRGGFPGFGVSLLMIAIAVFLMVILMKKKKF